MDKLAPYSASKRIVAYETIGFVCILLFIWFDEWIDLPRVLLGAAPSPINWKEALFESLFVAILGMMMVNHTRKMFRRMKYLEGILPVCSSCKKIRDEKNEWVPVDSYLHDRSAAQLSHGICPECKKKLYPELFKDS